MSASHWLGPAFSVCLSWQMSRAIGEGTSWLSWWQSLESALIFPAREGPGLEQLDAAAMRLPSSLPPPNLVVCPPVHIGPTGDVGVLSVLMVMKSLGAVGSEEATGSPARCSRSPPQGRVPVCPGPLAWHCARSGR